MGSKPGNSTPRRPSRVPPEARWDHKAPGFEWVAGPVDDAGLRHGKYRSWNRDGLLHGEADYDHGTLHGKTTNFHPDGTVASEAEWQHGVIMDSVFYRSDAPTPEPFAQAGPNVWSVRYHTRDGKTNHAIRYFTRAVDECGPDGKPLPPRPPGVSVDARWFPDLDRWVDGAIARGTNTQVGPWRWWSPAGVLRHEELRDADGRASLIVQYTADGSLEQRTTCTADGEARDHYGADGTLSTRARVDAAGRQIYRASWLRDGTLDEESRREYDGDTLARVTERRRGGALAFEARREATAMACMLYAADGKTIAAAGLVERGRLRGRWRIFDAAGALRREVDTEPLALAHEVTGDGLACRLGEALYVTDEPGLPLPAQLAGVDREPWAETPGCRDTYVEDFPRLLRGLASPDPLVRGFALGMIEGEIGGPDRGSVSAATARVIPYLARLLAHPSADRSRLIAALRAAGQAAHDPSAPDGGDDDGDDDRRAIAGALVAAWPEIFAIFRTATLDERRQLLAIARLVPAARVDVAGIARDDADPALRACAIDCLTAMPGFELADATPCLADRDRLVRAAAAIAIGRARGPRSPREVVDALGDALRNWQGIAAGFAALPDTDGHVLAALAVTAGAIRTPDARSLAQLLCAAIVDVDAASAERYADGLLALAFGGGERPFAKRFVEILGAIASRVDLVTADALVAKWRLPRDLATFVAELAAAPDAEALAHARLFGR